MATVRIDALLQSLREIINRLSDSLHRDLIPRLGQTLLQRLNRLVRLRACLLLQDAPNRIVHRVQVG